MARPPCVLIYALDDESPTGANTVLIDPGTVSSCVLIVDSLPSQAFARGAPKHVIWPADRANPLPLSVNKIESYSKVARTSPVSGSMRAEDLASAIEVAIYMRDQDTQEKACRRLYDAMRDSMDPSVKATVRGMADDVMAEMLKLGGPEWMDCDTLMAMQFPDTRHGNIVGSLLSSTCAYPSIIYRNRDIHAFDM